MQLKYDNKGVCSTQTILDLDDDTHIIKSCEIVGGCMGNTQGISSLLVGMKAEDAIERMKGIKCGFRSTSCPDQISIALTKALDELKVK